MDRRIGNYEKAPIIVEDKGMIVLAPSYRVLHNAKTPNTACTRQVGVCAFFKPFFLASNFSGSPAESTPAHLRVTQTVRRNGFEWI